LLNQNKQKYKMKKILLTALIATIGLTTQAQDLESAQNFLVKGELENAKKAIDELAQKDTKTATVQLLKGAIYQSIADDEKTKNLAPNGHAIALEAYKKYMTLEPKFKEEQVKPNLFNLIVINFNAAINNYNAQKYGEAIKSFDEVTDIIGLNGGKLFASERSLDTIGTQAKMYKGYSLYNDKKYAESKTIFEGIAENPIVKDADIYLRLSSIYQSLNETEKWAAIIEKGKAAYPSNKDILNDEINYYVVTNKQELLAKKLEEATTRNPNDADLLFSLGTTLENLASTKTAGVKPANAAELLEKAAVAYSKAIAIDDSKGDYHYNAGALLFNQGVEINAEMNKVLSDKKKYEPLKTKRADIFKKALPMLEKAMAVYEKGGVKPADGANYRNSLIALQKIYEVLENKIAKEAITKKLSAL
jgi:tetratricopeptide (TPR) repeat protein